MGSIQILKLKYKKNPWSHINWTDTKFLHHCMPGYNWLLAAVRRSSLVIYLDSLLEVTKSVKLFHRDKVQESK